MAISDFRTVGLTVGLSEDGTQVVGELRIAVAWRVVIPYSYGVMSHTITSPEYIPNSVIGPVKVSSAVYIVKQARFLSRRELLASMDATGFTSPSMSTPLAS